MNLNNIFNDIGISLPDDETRYKACTALWLEYRGSGTSLDEENIGIAAKSITRNRLRAFSLYINIVKPIIDKENSTYINPPTRVFTTKNGKNISKNLQTHIEQLLTKFRYDTFMQKFETDAALLGSVLVKPAYDENNDIYHLVELTPTEKTLKVCPNVYIKSLPDVVAYKLSTNIRLQYDNENITTIDNTSGTEVKTIEPHGFKGNLFTHLNFTPDNSTFYGPFDGTLYSFVKQRSLILANAMSALHLSEAERLVVSGMPWEEALEAIKDRMIVLPNDTADKAGNKIEQKVEVLGGQYQEAVSLIENYLKMYKHIMDVRGHTARQFSVSGDASSAEAIRLGGADMNENVARKRECLVNFEKDLWKRVIWLNNKIPGNPTIPEDTEITIDWKPDAFSFNSSQDEVIFFQAAIAKDIMTPISWVRSRQPELSAQEAEALWNANKKWNLDNEVHESGINIEDNIETTGDDLTETDKEDQDV